MENFYEFLGVAQDAPFEAIRAAYRRLAILLHPDKNKAPNATEAFQRLAHTWDTLKDSKTRSEYDTKLKAQRQKHRSATQAPPAPHPANTTNSSRRHPTHGQEDEEPSSSEDFMNSPFARSLRYQHQMHSANPMRTDDDIKRAQVQVAHMKREYQKQSEIVAEMINGIWAGMKIHRSGEEKLQEEKLQAAEAEYELVLYLSLITALEEDIQQRLAERATEGLEDLTF
jgi:curved DNA-binding protein CbpA